MIAWIRKMRLRYQIWRDGAVSVGNLARRLNREDVN